MNRVASLLLITLGPVACAGPPESGPTGAGPVETTAVSRGMRPTPQAPHTPLTSAAPAAVPLSVSELDVEGCVASPRSGPDEPRAPTPFETCRLQIGEIRPLPVFDEVATVARRKREPAACCYRRLGNR